MIWLYVWSNKCSLGKPETKKCLDEMKTPQTFEQWSIYLI